MSRIKITLEEAHNYPEACKSIIDHLKDTENIKWYYDWCEEVKGGMWEPSVEERIGNIYCSLYAHCGRKKKSVSLDKVPQKLIDRLNEQEEESNKEQERIDNLTEEEKQAEVEALLKQLRGYSGFIEL